MMGGKIKYHYKRAVISTPAKRANDGQILNAGLIAYDFLGDPDQYCKETIYFL